MPRLHQLIAADASNVAEYSIRHASIRAISVATALLAGVLAFTGSASAGSLERPIDSAQQTALAFGDRSHWLQPWRAYLDTVPAETLSRAVGINFNVPPARAAATARLLSETGFRRARVEVGWSDIDYSDRGRLRQDHDEAFRTRLTALRDNGLRPLILLNAHHGAPGPHRFFSARLVEPAQEGQRTIRVDAATAQATVPGRTGLNAIDQYKAADILFTAVDADGTVALSKPLPRSLGAGNQPAATLGFAPFERPRLAGGGPNPAFEETMSGWLQYVDVVTRRTHEILGSTEFDVEVWNELSFGSDFLDARRYYDPPPDVGVGDTNREILGRTVQFIRDPARGLAGVGIGNGFANTHPWDAGSTSPAGLTAIDKHPYKRMLRLPGGRLNPNQRPLNADGGPNGAEVDGAWHEDFTPAYNAFFPEYYLTGIQTEHLVRDLSPITTDMFGTKHGRHTSPPGAAAPQIWITETGMDFSSAESTDPEDPSGDPLRQLGPGDISHLRAKATLRATMAFVNKGVSALHFFAAEDADFGLIDGAFYDEVDRRGGGYPGTGSAGSTMSAMARLLTRFDGSHPIGTSRQLSLARVSDDHDQRQFDGGGSASTPPLYNRDVLAFLPFQVSDRRFAAGVYVMTRDLARVHRPDLGSSDPARFDLPQAPYRLTVGGVEGQTVTASAYDPLTDEGIEVRILARGADRVVVELPVTDSPRLLFLEDSGPAQQGPSSPPQRSQPPLRESAPLHQTQLRVTSVRLRRNRIVVAGRATPQVRVRLRATLRHNGRRHTLGGSAGAQGGSFKAALAVPRSARSSGAIRRLELVAHAADASAKSSWRIATRRAFKVD